MKKPVLVFTRPWDWVEEGYGSDELKLVYVPIGGKFPRRKNGRPAGDGVGQVATSEGIRQLREAFKKYKPEMFLYWVHFRFGLDEMARLKETSPRTRFICGYGNQPHTISDHVKKFKPFIDTILLNSRDEGNYQKYLDFGIPHVGTLHDGFDPKEWVPRPGPRPFDVFFGGNQAYTVHGDRKVFKYPVGEFRYELLCRVNQAFDLHVRGNNKLPFKVHPYLFWPDYAPVWQKARVVLGCPHYDLQQYYSRRTIHAGACGRLFVTRYIPNMEADFGPNHHCAVWFKEIDEAVDVIRYYLDHEEEREAIGRRCRELFVREHSWQARLRDMERIAREVMA